MGYDNAPTRSRTKTRRPNPTLSWQPNSPHGHSTARPEPPPLIPPVVYTPTSTPQAPQPSKVDTSGAFSALAPGQDSTTDPETTARDPAVPPVPLPAAPSIPNASANVPPPGEATVSMLPLPPAATPSVTPTTGDPGTGVSESGSSSLFTLPVLIASLAVVAVSLAVVIAVFRRMRSSKAASNPAKPHPSEPASVSPPDQPGNVQQSTPRLASAQPSPELAAASIGSATISPSPTSAGHPPLASSSFPTIAEQATMPDSPPLAPIPLSRTTPPGTGAAVPTAVRASLAPTNRSRSDVGSVPGTQYSPTLYAQKLGGNRRGSRDSIQSASSGTLYYAASRAASTTTVSPTDGAGGVLSDAMSANVASPPLPPMSPVATSPAMWRLSTGSGFEAYQQHTEQVPVGPWPPLPRTVTLDRLDGTLLSPSAATGATSTAVPPLSPAAEVTSESLSTWVRSTFRTDFDTLEHESNAGSIRGLRALRETAAGSDLGGSALGLYCSDEDEDGAGSILSMPGTPLTDAFSGIGSGGTGMRRPTGAPHALAVPGHGAPVHPISQPLSPLTLVEFPTSDGEASADSGSLEAQEQGEEGAGRAA